LTHYSAATLLQVMQDTWCEFQQLYPSQLAAAQEAAAAGAGLFAADAASAVAVAAGQEVRQAAAKQLPDLNEQYWQQLLLDR
jgi:hypothetical protein